MRQKDQDVVERYTQLSDGYDESVFQDYRWALQIVTMDRMRLEPGAAVLEVACGTGEGTLEVARRLADQGEVVGLDLTPAMLDQAKAKLAESPHSNVTFIEGSAEDIPYEDDHFEYCFTTSAFHHMSNKLGVFQEVHRVLKPGGLFLVGDYCADVLRMRIGDLIAKVWERGHVGTTTSEGLGQLFREAGFQQVGVDTMKMGSFWFSMIGRGVK